MINIDNYKLLLRNVTNKYIETKKKLLQYQINKVNLRSINSLYGITTKDKALFKRKVDEENEEIEKIIEKISIDMDIEYKSVRYILERERRKFKIDLKEIEVKLYAELGKG